jgi:hypothetical protein
MSLLSDLTDLIPGVSEIKLSASTVIYIVVGLAIAALIGFGIWEAHEVKTLDTQLDAANKTLSNTIVGLQKSGQVNDVVSNTDVTQKQDAAASSTAITTNAQQQVQQVIQKYQPQGPAQVLPASTAAAEQTAVSTIQLGSAWQTYCLAAPKDTQCAEVTPSITTHPASAVSVSPASN